MRYFLKSHIVLSAVFALAMLMQSLMLVHVHNSHDDSNAHTHIQCQILSKINWSAPSLNHTLCVNRDFKHVVKLQLLVESIDFTYPLSVYLSRAPPFIAQV